MRQRVDEFDWSATPLGARSQWPVSLRTVVDLALGSNFPQAIVWGPAMITIHNDAFLPILGDKPSALGRSFADVWEEAWDNIAPIAEKAYRGESTYIENFPLVIDRHGFNETAYFTFCYSPIRGDDGSIAGMMDTVVETTTAVLAEHGLRQSEARFRAFTNATSDVVYRMSADWKEMHQLEGRGFLVDTLQPSVTWQNKYLFAEDLSAIERAIGEAIAAKTMFAHEHRVRRADGSVGWTLSRAVPVLDDAGAILEWFGAASDINDRKLAEEHQELINREMSHRLKNSLAMVQAIATQTLRPVGERQYVVALQERIQALSSAHDILFDRYWHKAPIRSLVSSTLRRLVPEDRLDVEGADVMIGPKSALSLSLVLHEMATNAVKYGAFSNDRGRVAVSWHVEGVGEHAVFHLTWIESGGPCVTSPSEKGFGSKLIRLGLIGTGGVEVRYDPAGFQARMTAPLQQLQHTP
jgi:two-component sensor histidine kinase/PAS domain-containing protein